MNDRDTKVATLGQPFEGCETNEDGRGREGPHSEAPGASQLRLSSLMVNVGTGPRRTSAFRPRSLPSDAPTPREEQAAEQTPDLRAVGTPRGEDCGEGAGPPHHTLRHPTELVAAGLTDSEHLAALEAVAARYAVAITPDMINLIDPDGDDDPIGRQFVPDPAELRSAPGESDDPIGDDVHETVPGLIHRYPDRVLLKFTSICPVYCRFCFRRETVGQGDTGVLSDADLDQALNYIRSDDRIWEVIVSGGDPLIAAPRRLARLTAAIAAIAHVRVIRFHTRVPVVAPARVTEALVEALRAPGATTWVAIHANHPRELTTGACDALSRLFNAGIPLVSQTVLLSGVNDDPDTLGQLMRAFVEARVKPYYLHHGDLAPGTGHFRTGIGQGQDLMRRLRGRVSGLCQPAYVLDIPGGHGKVPIGPCYVDDTGRGEYEVADVNGVRHGYRDD